MRKITLLFLLMIMIGCVPIGLLTENKVRKNATPIIEKMATKSVEKLDFCYFDYILIKKMKEPMKISTEKNDIRLDLIWWNYWGNDTKIRLDISPEIIAKNIENTFVTLAKEQNLEQNLNGKKLYIIFSQIPNNFYFVQNRLVYEDKKDRLYEDDFKNKNEITADEDNIIIKYAFIEEKGKSSERTVKIEIERRDIEKTSSWKHSVRYYFNEYKFNLAVVAAELMNAISNDLKTYKSINQ